MITAPNRYILLIVPPFQTIVRPALGVSQLKANLQEQGFPTKILYLNFRFAERIGLDLYEWISENTFNTLLGEFIFSGVLFHRSDEHIKQYVKQVLESCDLADSLRRIFPHKSLQQITRWLIQKASTFCNDAIKEVWVHNSWMIGLTSSFQQNCASLALIRRIKQGQPGILTSLGGANCQSEMGRELFRQFPEIDYIGQGECDHSFVSLVRSLRNGNIPDNIPGILSRVNGQHPPSLKLLQDEDLDQLPYPDFSDYFAQLKKVSFADRIAPGLLMETSRGCWWGAKQPCTFCGLNGEEIGFRSKSASRAKDEMAALVRKYGIQHIYMADNILDKKYFMTLLTELAEHPLADIFYETKSNLSRTSINLLSRSHIGWIQPGIESLSDQTLRLMRKGTTKLQNIQLLKWCAEYGIWVGWNYLYGFPDERRDEIADIARDIEALHHLQPPSKTLSIRIDRFSTYFNTPHMYGLDPISPAEPYRRIYPFPGDSLKKIAYFFQSDFFTNVAKSDAFKRCQTMVADWQTAYYRSYLLMIPRKKSLIIIDTRPCAQRFWHRLVDVKRVVYEFCDKASTMQQIRSALGSAADSKLESILESLVRARLMIHSDGRYLSLAVMSRPNCGKVARAASGGFIMPRKDRQRLLRLIRFQIPPGKILSSIAQRASNEFRSAKKRLLSKAIFHLNNFLSQTIPDESIDSGDSA